MDNYNNMPYVNVKRFRGADGGQENLCTLNQIRSPAEQETQIKSGKLLIKS